MSFEINLRDLTETINQHFLRTLASAPLTFCVVQVPSKFYLKGVVSYKPSGYCIRFKLTLQLPNDSNATFAIRLNDDSTYTMYSDDAILQSVACAYSSPYYNGLRKSKYGR